jgi:hypothetical protein
MDRLERECHLLLGWTEAAISSGHGPPDTPWSRLSPAQRDAAKLLGCDEARWSEAIEEEKEAALERAEEAATPLREQAKREEMDEVLREMARDVEKLLEEEARARAAAIRAEEQRQRDEAGAAQAQLLGLSSFKDIRERAAAAALDEERLSRMRLSSAGQKVGSPLLVRQGRPAGSIVRGAAASHDASWRVAGAIKRAERGGGGAQQFEGRSGGNASGHPSPSPSPVALTEPSPSARELLARGSGVSRWRTMSHEQRATALTWSMAGPGSPTSRALQALVAPSTGRPLAGGSSSAVAESSPVRSRAAIVNSLRSPRTAATTFDSRSDYVGHVRTPRRGGSAAGPAAYTSPASQRRRQQQQLQLLSGSGSAGWRSPAGPAAAAAAAAPSPRPQPAPPLLTLSPRTPLRQPLRYY